MALSDFIACRRFLHDGNRRYAVRRPTLATVHRFLELYGVEVIAMNEANKTHPGCLNLDTAFQIVKFDERMRRVLETCVETEEEPSRWPLSELARVAAEMADLPRICESLNLPSADEATQNVGLADDGPTDQEISVIALAEKFGVPPHTITDWPYETFLNAIECVNVMTPRPDGTVGESDFEKLCRLQAEGKLH